jgi:hypothetical protein
LTYRDHQQLARNLAEVIEELYDVERPRERRVELIAVHVLRAIRIRISEQTHHGASCGGGGLEQISRSDKGSAARWGQHRAALKCADAETSGGGGEPNKASALQSQSPQTHRTGLSSLAEPSLVGGGRD